MECLKVKLPKEVAKAIEELRGRNLTNAMIIHGTVGFDPSNLGEGSMSVVRKWILTVSTHDKLIRALVNGYEVEKTPEERLKVYFDYNSPSTLRDDRDLFYEKKGRQYGVRKALQVLGITIEGING